MQRRNTTLWYSPTDLSNFLGCEYSTHLDLAELAGGTAAPFRENPTLDLLVELGQRHERTYWNHLQSLGHRVRDLSGQLFTEDVSSTVTAMEEGYDVIFQPWLVDSPWRGRADFLLRVDTPSRFGTWSYIAADTKLAVNTKATSVLQLCFYSEIVGELQGKRPEQMLIVKPGNQFEEEWLRPADFLAYCRIAKSRFLEYVTANPTSEFYPEPCAHCNVCRWATVCEQKWRQDDHLSFIAGCRRAQRKEIESQGINTLVQFASASAPLPNRPERGSIEAFERVHRQAKVQLAGRQSKAAVFEFEPFQAEKGLNRLPEPNSGDLFFDIEGIPRASERGIEYLLGIVDVSTGKPEYQTSWSFDKTSERRAFQRLISLLHDRLAKYPAMHIYHYAPYEPAALKRLAMFHGILEDEVDIFVRGEKFVDLFQIVRQAISASVESYSIKQLEPFYGYLREEPLETARKSLLCIERLIELGEATAVTDDVKASVERYNRDDCLSTWRLREWLESLREFHPFRDLLSRPPIIPGDASDNTQNESAETKVRFDQLTEDIERVPTTEEQRARWLLAHQLDYFRREAKCSWWDYFRLRDLPAEELVFEKTALSGLEFIEEIPPAGRSKLPVHRYSFPVQECIVGIGDSLWHDEENVGSCVEFDIEQRVIGIRRTGATVDRHPPTAYAFDLVRPGSMPESLRTLADMVIQAKQANTVPKSARYELLASKPPRLRSLVLPCSGDIIDVATKVALDLDESYLAIQGPPGAGKTYLGGRMIYNLVLAGKRIGVTALSHRVILNLLEEVIDAAGSGAAIRLAHQGNVDGYNYTPQLRSSKDKNQSLTLLNEGCVVGGTAWLWSDPLLDQQLDYLFIDEAGQMALALALAASRAARNVILLGDPQQLEQPQLGDHPEGAGVAALAHALSGKDTIEPTKGIFLSRTWRLSPEITRFTSEQYYEGRLTSEKDLENQKIVGPANWSGSGLKLVEVEHDGRENFSPEEVEEVAKAVGELTSGSYQWENKSRVISPLTLADILIVAPFNVQVQALVDRLPDGARIGTVDKFQGQEAPIVIYSMTSSSIDVAPRGSKFLFSRHRMNVATSRAKCLAIVFASPKLLAPPCNTPDSMRLANGLCRFAELGISQRKSP